MEQLVAERLPLADTRSGVLRDIVVMLNGVLAAVNQQNVDRLIRSGSLLEINKDPSLADDTLVDRVLSNFMVSRRQATKATGVITVVIDSLFPVNIPAASQIEINGKLFVSDAAYAAKTSSANVIADTDRLLQPTGDGNFAFQISVTAVDPGIASVKRGNSAILVDRPPRFVKAYAEQDFNDGFDKESTEDLIRKLQLGLSAKTIAGRSHITSLIYDQPSFESVLGVSVVGFGDAEMKRDKIGIMEVSTGGCADIYIKSSRNPVVMAVVKQATLVEKTVNGYGVWQVSLSRDEAAGVYDILQINAESDPSDKVGGFAVSQEIRAVDETNDIYVPRFRSSSDAVYSRYQTITLQFEDTTTITDQLTVNVSRKNYRLFVRKSPLVASIQAFLGQRSVLNPSGDVLVLAALPCFTTVNLTLHKRGGETIDVAAIRSAISEFISSTAFPTKIYASSIIDTVSNYIPSSVGIVKCDMFGKIRRPNGTTAYVRNAEVLEVPNEPALGVSGRTVAFYTSPSDIGITVETAAVIEV